MNQYYKWFEVDIDAWIYSTALPDVQAFAESLLDAYVGWKK